MAKYGGRKSRLQQENKGEKSKSDWNPTQKQPYSGNHFDHRSMTRQYNSAYRRRIIVPVVAALILVIIFIGICTHNKKNDVYKSSTGIKESTSSENSDKQKMKQNLKKKTAIQVQTDQKHNTRGPKVYSKPVEGAIPPPEKKGPPNFGTSLDIIE